MFEDLGVAKGVEHIETGTDSSAAVGILTRRGLGNVTHIALNRRWLQDNISTGEIEIAKCKGVESPSDALTTFVDSKGIDNHMVMCSAEADNTRHEMAPST